MVLLFDKIVAFGHKFEQKEPQDNDNPVVDQVCCKPPNFPLLQHLSSLVTSQSHLISCLSILIVQGLFLWIFDISQGQLNPNIYSLLVPIKQHNIINEKKFSLPQFIQTENKSKHEKIKPNFHYTVLKTLTNPPSWV